MANTRKKSPAAKKRKTNTNLGLNVTFRARNGGDGSTFVPADLNVDEGSSTEEEDNTEMENEFLNKMVDDKTDSKQETVFGPDTEVWQSHGGTIYADFNDKTKRKLREKELWTKENIAKVHVGSKRKIQDMTPSFSDSDGDSDSANDAEDEAPKSSKPQTKPSKSKSKPVHTYRTRTPTDTLYHHGSAGIDPLGAHNRPIHPLPKRLSSSSNSTPHTPVLAADPARVTTQGIYNSPLPSNSHTPHRLAPQTNSDGMQRRLLPVQQQQQQQHDGRTASRAPGSRLGLGAGRVSEGTRRVVSGSFGSFEGGGVSRFDGRGYRLVQGGGKVDDGEDDGDGDGGDGEKPSLFRKKPWLW